MAKIDITKIENFDTMSVEEKLQALQNFEYDEQDDSKYDNLKKLFDKNASELAQAKRDLKSKMSEDEINKLNNEQAQKELQEKYDKLLRETEHSKNKANFLALGYDEKLAEDTATAMIDGDFTKVFANQKKHLENMEKKMKADILKDTPPPVPDGDGVMSLEDFNKLSWTDKVKFKAEKPEEYNKLNGGN